jgi:thiol-disulfide isomerase/thioredoxin
VTTRAGWLVGAVLVAAAAGVALGILAGQRGLNRGLLAQRAFDEMNAGARPGGAPMITIGQAVPAFQLPDLRGGTSRSVPATGRPMLINYWASWCGPCRREMPMLSDYARQQGSNGVQVLGIALDEPEDARAWLAANPSPFPQLVEVPTDGDSSARLGNLEGLLPFTVLLDAQGRLQHRQTGPFADREAIEAWVAEAGVVSPAR